MGKTPQRIVELLHAEIPGKISKNKFCIQTGINQNSVDKYMAGVTEPTNVSMKKLADYFEVDVEWLRGNSLLTYDEAKEWFEGSKDHDKYLEQLEERAKNLEATGTEVPDSGIEIKLSEEDMVNFMVLKAAYMAIPPSHRGAALTHLYMFARGGINPKSVEK